MATLVLSVAGVACHAVRGDAVGSDAIGGADAAATVVLRRFEIGG